MAENLKEIVKVERVQEICGYIRTGADFVTAFVASGLTMSQAEALRDQVDGDPEDSFLKDLKDAIVRAVACFEILQLQRIIQEGGASGAKWILEKRLPGRYGRQKGRLPGKNDFVEIEDSGPGPVAPKSGIGKDDFKAGG